MFERVMRGILSVLRCLRILCQVDYNVITEAKQCIFAEMLREVACVGRKLLNLSVEESAPNSADYLGVAAHVYKR